MSFLFLKWNINLVTSYSQKFNIKALKVKNAGKLSQSIFYIFLQNVSTVSFLFTSVTMSPHRLVLQVLLKLYTKRGFPMPQKNI